MRRENHLRTPNEFSFVYRTGRRSRTDSVVAVIATAPVTEAPKVGFATSRKTGNAVRRNRARRRLRAAVDPLVDKLAPGFMVVLQATNETATVPFTKLEADLRLALDGALDA